MEILLLDAFAPFTSALMVVLGIAALEVAGLLISGIGLSHLGDWLGARNSFSAGGWMNLLIVRGLPFSIAVVLFITSFGVLGIVTQIAYTQVQGDYLELKFAVPAAVVAAWAGLRLVGGVLSPVFTDQLKRADAAELVGTQGEIRAPRCTPDIPAQIRVRDQSGRDHTVTVTPARDTEFFMGDLVVLHEHVGRHEFTALKVY